MSRHRPFQSKKLPRSLKAVFFLAVAAVSWSWQSLDAAEKPDFTGQINSATSTGIYSDGWIGAMFTTFVPSKGNSDLLLIEGEVPDLSSFSAAGVTMRVVLNSASVAERAFKIGDFAFALPVTKDGFTLRIETNPLARLPAPDGRMVACRLTRIRLIDSADLPALNLPVGKMLAIFDRRGIAPDGWADAFVTLKVPTTRDCVLHVRLQIPEWSGLAAQHLTISTGVTDRREIELRPGFVDVDIPVKDQQRTVTLKSESTFAIPVPDGRTVSFKIESIRLTHGP